MGNGSSRSAFRTFATLTLAFAAVLPAFGKSGANDDAGAGTARNFDRRATLESAAPSLAPVQAQAVERLRSAVPDLLATADVVTGATRSLSNATGYLTGARSGDAEQIAVDFAAANLELLGLTAEDLDDYEVTNRVLTSQNGVTHLYLRQRHAGLSVYNGQLHANVAADGRILSVNNQFVPRLADALNTTEPAIAPEAAVAALAQHLGGYDLAGKPTSEPQLMILPIRPGEARLVWNFNVDLGNAWYDVTVDAVDGSVWTRFDWVSDAQYRVYQRPVEAPTFVAPLPPADGRVTVVDPQNATASPFGWHDTNGAAGADTTLTSGNNVNACIDRSPANNVCDAGSQPDGGASLIFTPTIDLTQTATSYQPAAVVNLYYWNNIIHDVAYLYGFDELGGNFQENNYGNGGAGSDSVHADAQDGAGNNNANFGTPPDGSNPRMQMFLWTIGTPTRDGDLDAGIIAHEYGHGISNRLVGGPANVGCMGNAEQPGEGTSDWWSLFYTFEAANPAVRGIGTYALFQPTNGDGIRTELYDKNVEPNSNPWTYGSLPGSAVPHGVGEKWAQAFWYAQGRLEDEHGFDADVYDFTGTATDAGNVRAMFYIIEGLKNAACSPGFVDTRDGIIEAATSSYGGEDVCLLWQAFADYGLGFSASQGSNNSINDQVPAFDIPPSCTGGPGGDYCATPGLAIPDNLPAGVSNTMAITDTGDIQDLDIELNVTHSWVGDLIFTLTHVDTGTAVTFFDRPGVPVTGAGCNGNDIPGVFGDDEGTDGSFEANCANATPAFPAAGRFTNNNPLSAFDGEDLAGDWTLSVSDNAGADTGTLVEWCIVPTTGPTTEPDIAVDPVELSSLQVVDTQVTLGLDILNNGDADLDWTVAEGLPLAGRPAWFLPRSQSGPFLPHKQTATYNAEAARITIGDHRFSAGSSLAPGTSVTPVRPEAPTGTVTITHSTTQNITSGNSVSCNAGGLHTDNSYIRRFTLADFGITSDFDVEEVEVGVEQAIGNGGTQPVTVNLYTWDPSDPFTFANFSAIGTANATVSDQSLTVLAIPVTGTAPAGSTLVVELFTPNGQTTTNSFFVGSNADGQTDASFLAAADCGVVEPTDVAVIGFPNMHIVMNVTGVAGGCGDDLTWVSATPLAGTTTPAGTSTVDVTFDSTGLALGDILLGSLCIDSNDPDTPTVVVPLTLEVDTMPFLDGFESGDTSAWTAVQP